MSSLCDEIITINFFFIFGGVHKINPEKEKGLNLKKFKNQCLIEEGEEEEWEEVEQEQQSEEEEEVFIVKN